MSSYTNPGRRSLGGGNPDTPNDRPGRVGKMVLLDGPGGLGVRPRTVGRTRFEPVAVLREVLDRNDRARELRRERVRAGLGPTGMATYTYSRGYGSYDPSDPDDVERVRKIIRAADGDAAADAWTPHPGLTPAKPEPPDSDERPRCHVCGARFASNPRLGRHLAIHHPDAEPPPSPPDPEPEHEEPEEPEPAPDLTPDDVRQIYADDPYVTPREVPPWVRS